MLSSPQDSGGGDAEAAAPRALTSEEELARAIAMSIGAITLPACAQLSTYSRAGSVDAIRLRQMKLATTMLTMPTPMHRMKSVGYHDCVLDHDSGILVALMGSRILPLLSRL
jgi:hypothetical protein